MLKFCGKKRKKKEKKKLMLRKIYPFFFLVSQLIETIFVEGFMLIWISLEISTDGNLRWPNNMKQCGKITVDLFFCVLVY